MKIITQKKQPTRLSIKRKQSDIVDVELNGAFAWISDFKGIDYDCN